MHEGETATTKFFGRVDSAEIIGPVMVAMANSAGGRIFIGIDLKNAHLSGTSLDAGWIQNVIAHHCKPRFKVGVELIEKSERRILCVTIPTGQPTPNYFNETCYVMQGSQSRPATDEEELEMQNTPSPPVAELAEAADEAIFQQDLHTLTSELLELVRPEPAQLNNRQQKTLEFLNEQPAIKNKQYRELFNVSHKTAHLELVALVAKGYISSQGNGRNTCYKLTS